MDKTRIVLQVPPEMVERIDQAANKEFMKRNSFVIKSCMQKVEEILNGTAS